MNDEETPTMNKNKQRTLVSRHLVNIVLGIGIVLFAACGQDDYYTDGGRVNPQFDGSIMAYLDAHPIQLDTIAEIVRLAGLEEVFNTEEFTFFAPRDEEIKELIGQVNYIGDDPLLTQTGANQLLYDLGLDTIRTLADVDSAIWRKYMERYMFRGRKLLKDYPQVDFDVINTFGGQNYFAYNNTVSNIGVVFNDAVTDEGKPTETRLKYMGYRQLYISYIWNISDPDPINWEQHRVSSSDIQPTNGVVHVLDFTFGGGFGFAKYDVMSDIIQSKR